MELQDLDHHVHIEGTTIFDGEMAMKGYALNKMCFSFNKAVARDAYLADPEAYMEKFGLNEDQKQACRDKNVLAMIAAGGNIYYLAKFAGIFKLSVQDVGAQQTGMTTEEFKEKLLRQGD
ncbi:Protocatechuate 4,5-dioxygenase alpha chain [Thalassovita gelatinovora]|uniref:Protocatechuate 4,5-dioxygenase alpha chain n=1 Tax=Thalassovita gelatinovora TaxID=53501 RepID=A0A0P1FJ48_THAGE|nr:protocatechuate 4,5-dioxygenase subunit alpha [Thalassovita gelatinovora]QIZ82196.1 protocatechuate 4,5-dioxygenase subunit alpha [Thalassovita gelatinovora]CUH67825.1 Protocatechuate 4,5-dioxygenase alpha chain [Thalassovita gelatinovora]SEP66540.1 protocatechuate 4,5-dioxygenase alpha subunit [Thalassovita gelatinovora]